MMAGCDKITITAKGKGGHSSMINELTNPVHAICLLNVRIEEMMTKKYGPDYHQHIRMSFPYIQSAKACNVIPDESVLEGVIRTFDNELRKKVIEDVKSVVPLVEKETGCVISVDVFQVGKSSVNNDPQLTQNLLKILGGKVKKDRLPIYASEDFASFQLKIPGVFFFLAGGSQCGDSLHVDNFNFNDDIIEKGADIFFEIVKDRYSHL